MKKTLFGFVLIVLCLIILMTSGFTASAQKYINYQEKSQYYSYEYNCYNELSPAPDGYVASEVIYSSDLGIDMTDSVLADLFYDGKKIYLLDSALGRVIILNSDFSLKSVITGEDISCGKYKGTDCTFTGASGIFVEDDGKLLICDTERERVLFVKNNTLVGIIKRPDSSVLSKSIKFDVKKIAKAKNGYYVSAESVVVVSVAGLLPHPTALTTIVPASPNARNLPNFFILPSVLGFSSPNIYVHPPWWLSPKSLTGFN